MVSMAGKPKKRSLTIAGHRTSISLEDDFWDALKDMGKEQGRSVPTLISEIDASRGPSGLSSAIRSAILAFYRAKTVK
jgi:predicted DNA-binding ribbon-helix-helix protein